MAALDSQKAAVDTAWAGLETAVSAFLAAGGSAESVGVWLLANVAGLDPAISRIADAHGNKAINNRALRAATFAATPER